MKKASSRKSADSKPAAQGDREFELLGTINSLEARLKDQMETSDRYLHRARIAEMDVRKVRTDLVNNLEDLSSKVRGLDAEIGRIDAYIRKNLVGSKTRMKGVTRRLNRLATQVDCLDVAIFDIRMEIERREASPDSDISGQTDEGIVSDDAVPGETLEGVAEVLAAPEMVGESLGRFQDARWLFGKSGLSGTIDTAVPQDWADRARVLGIDCSGYVWWYPEGSIFGEPKSKFEMALLAVARGAIHMDEAVAMAEKYLSEEGR